MKTIPLDPIPKSLTFEGTLKRLRTPKRKNFKSFGHALAHSYLVSIGQARDEYYPDFVCIQQKLYVKKYEDNEKEWPLQFNVSPRVGKPLEHIEDGTRIKISCSCRPFFNGLGAYISRIKLLEVYDKETKS